jgi:invasion protein IalB
LSLRIFLLSAIIISSLNAKSFAQTKTDGQFKNWSAQNSNINNQLVCFAVSRPVSSDPKKINRAESRIFVSFRSTDNLQNEVSITSGYTYKPGSKVILTIDKNQFQFEVDDNYAWLTKYDQEASLVEIMQKSSQLNVMATSSKGTKTIDTFSLSGFAEAYKAAKKKCNFNQNEKS